MEKKFIIRCAKCRWAKTTTGISSDLTDLFELKKGCTHCGGRQFRCPKCGRPAKMTAIKGI